MTVQSRAFGNFLFDKQRNVLLRNGRPVVLGQRGLALLNALLDANGKPVAKADLLRAAWQTENIEDSNLAVQIAALRKALGPGPEGTEWITTVQRFGYQLSLPAPAGPSHSGAEGGNSDDRPSVAVLPFSNLSADPGQVYLSDGVASDIITELTRWRLLSVRSRSASFRFRGTNADVKRIAAELGVRYIVDGSVRRMAGRIRIAAELVDAESGNQVWSEKYDRDADEIFAVQDQVVRTIVSTLVGRVIAASVNKANRKTPRSLMAYECVLKGNALPWADPSGADEAAQLFARAIELDPGYGMAHALLGTMHHVKWYSDMGDTSPFPQMALDLARRAVDLDPEESSCHSLLSQMQLASRGFDSALQTMQRAQALNPNNQWNAADMGIIQYYLGYPERALGHFAKAREVDPYFEPPWFYKHLGATYLSLQRYAEAVEALERCQPRTFRISALLAAAQARLSNLAEAKALASACLASCPQFSISRYLAKEPYRDAGQLDHLRQSLSLAGFAD